MQVHQGFTAGFVKLRATDSFPQNTFLSPDFFHHLPLPSGVSPCQASWLAFLSFITCHCFLACRRARQAGLRFFLSSLATAVWRVAVPGKLAFVSFFHHLPLLSGVSPCRAWVSQPPHHRSLDHSNNRIPDALQEGGAICQRPSAATESV
jgi:hypothetical protein